MKRTHLYLVLTALGWVAVIGWHVAADAQRRQPAEAAETGIEGWQQGVGWGWIWGDDDEVGSLNAMNEQSVLGALQIAQEGKVYDLGITYSRRSFKWPGHSPGEVMTFRTPEGVARQGVRLGSLERDGRGRAGRSIEQRQLTEEVPIAQRGDDGLLAFEAGQHDLHRSRAEDVERVTRITLVEDRLAAPESAEPEVACDGREGVLLGTLEEARVTQGGDDQLLVHDPTVASPSRSSQAALTARAACRLFDTRLVSRPCAGRNIDRHATVIASTTASRSSNRSRDGATSV